jgi:branched-chain amino acid transport system ATP-binding protein
MSSDTFSFPDEGEEGEGDSGGAASGAGSAGSTATQSAGGRAASTSEELLRIENLSVSYGKIQALQGIDLHLDQGEIVSVIGPNGAGKTTLSNTVTGFLPYEGSVRFRGQEIAGNEVAGLVDQGLIQCTEKRNLFGYMDVDDNLRLGAYREDEEEVVEQQLEFVYNLFPRLEERKEQNARTMSGGEQQMLAVGRSLMGRPDLLVLDEPTLGLAPVILQDISEGLETMQDEGVNILLAEQNVTFAMNHADRIYLLEQGEIVREGSPDELEGDDYVQEAYIGG